MTLTAIRGADLYIDLPRLASKSHSILFVHGGPGGNSAFEQLVAIRSQAFAGIVDVAFYDQRGCGRSPETTKISHDDNVQDLLEILSRKVRAPTILIAHSYGCALALKAAQLLPAKVSGLVLLAPVINFSRASGNLYLHSLTHLKAKSPGQFQEYMKKVCDRGGGNMFSRRQLIWDQYFSVEDRMGMYWFDALKGKEYMQFQIEKDFSDRVSRQLRPKLFDSSSRLFPDSTQKFRETCESIRNLPVCIIAGAEDVVADAVQGNEIADLLRYSYVETFTETCCGHFPHLEKAESTAAIVREFLKRV